MSLVKFLRRGISKVLHKLEPPRNKWPIDKLVSGAMDGYEYAQGYSFDIRKPELFSEKVIWYKLFFNRAGLVNIVDKYLFKDYLASKVGKKYVVPLYGAWSSVSDFRKAWDSLPNAFCLKSTLKSDSQFIIVVHDKSKFNLDDVCKEVKKWLVVKNTLINSFCRAYYEATPRIIAEELISELAGQSYDYKIFCFGGKPYCVYTYL